MKNRFFVSLLVCFLIQKSLSQELEIFLTNKAVEGEVGDTIQIQFEIVNNSPDVLKIDGLIETKKGFLMNGLMLQEGNSVHISSLSGSWRKGENPRQSVFIRPSERKNAYITWKIKGPTVLELLFGEMYKSEKRKVDIQVVEKGKSNKNE